MNGGPVNLLIAARCSKHQVPDDRSLTVLPRRHRFSDIRRSIGAAVELVDDSQPPQVKLFRCVLGNRDNATDGVARIKLGRERHLKLGNLDAIRDWGHAMDYVRAMALMLQQDAPGNYVIATGRTASIREFCAIAFGYAGLDWEDHVLADPTLLRPAEVDLLHGDTTKARAVLGWEPENTLEDMVAEMVDMDIYRLRRGKIRVG